MFASTYPPRQCGVATFTQALSSATGEREIVALHGAGPYLLYPSEVHHRMRRDEPGDYARTARDLSRCADVVSIQHEYGIWGGDDGAAVLDFVHALDAPAVATLHTVLRHPTPNQRAVLLELIRAAAATVVMSRSAAHVLTGTYGVAARSLDVIPHGVPNLPLVDAETIKPALDLAGCEVILSFGLLRPDKGLELVLDALPAVVAARPTACYVVLGATHPNQLAVAGEAYRRSLEARVARLGMGQHVRFIDRFVGRVELTRWLEGADVFVTPYANLDQVGSGTLSYAMGAGRAIVSTPYAYAVELLDDGRGVLAPPGSPAAWADALIGLLENDELRTAVGRRAHEHSRSMVWSNVASQYRQLFARVVAGTRIPTRPTGPRPGETSAIVDTR
ncbi:MAG TPA: glycosyltransferase family 4 protein [Patescibacteria group bacterium]|nr:glycosyltransferase family 4 protein [Patescibacteria group bacterium]